MSEVCEAKPVVGGDEKPWWAPSNKREVYDWMVPAVRAKLDKLNARAEKLGLPGFSVTVGEPFERQHPDPVKARMGIMLTYVSIEVLGPVVKVAGWELIGRVDFEDGSNIVSTRPGAVMPNHFRATNGWCEHCKTMRKRNSIFVFKADADGKHIQVGRSCLRDFMGASPEAALWSIGAFSNLFAEIDDALNENRGRRDWRVLTVDVLQAAAQTVREHGFMSKKAAMDQGGMSSADDVSDLLFNPNVYAKVAGRYGTLVDGRKRPTAEEAAADRAKAERVASWVLDTWGAKPDSERSDYEYNAVELLMHDSVSPQRIGLLTSLIAAYDREHEEAKKREKLVDAWVGKIKERREFDTIYLGCNSFDGSFGTMWIGRFATPEGMLVYKGNAPFWNTGIDAGAPVKFKGTIKAHDDYKGRKQTLVSRCVIVDEASA